MCVCMYVCICVFAVVKSVSSSNNSCKNIRESYPPRIMSKDQHLRDLLLEKTSEVQRAKAEIDK